MGRVQDKIIVAELCGTIVGDGWIQSNEQSFFIAGDVSEDKPYYDIHLKKLFGEVLTEVNPREFPYWRVYGISIHKKAIIKNILKWGIQKGKKVDIASVPEWILNGNKNIIKAFLRGLFDTDGCVFCQRSYGKYNSEFDKMYHSKIRLRITSISPRLIEEIFSLCNRLGLRITKNKRKGGIRNNKRNSDVYLLNINEMKSIYKWFNEISPSNPKHITKFEVWKKFGFCPPETTIKQREEMLKNNLNPYNLYKQG